MSNILYIFDIDGTIADMEWRIRRAGPEPDKKNKKKYKAWLKRIQSKKMLLEDVPVPGMKEMVNALKKHSVYLTARQEIYRDVTKKWLKMHGFPSLNLYMRQKNDWNSNGVYKEAVILDLMEKMGYNVIVIIDDDPHGDIQKVCKVRRWTMIKALSGS
jgi:phosphoglycolate phosphatase-like HAD superfamily hydrolase